MDTWILVEPHMKVFKGTCAFKLKRTQDGVAHRYRSQFHVCGDQQQYAVNYFETFAPVVQWNTIRLLLILILTNHWTTRVIDYTYVFLQTNINTEIYVEPPALFGSKKGDDNVLKLRKACMGLNRAQERFANILVKVYRSKGGSLLKLILAYL